MNRLQTRANNGHRTVWGDFNLEVAHVARPSGKMAIGERKKHWQRVELKFDDSWLVVDQGGKDGALELQHLVEGLW